MKIRLNGAWRELDGAADRDDADSCTPDPLNTGLALVTVLERLGYGQSLVATALNGEFVPVRARAGMSVREGDRLEVLAPMQGG